MQGYGAYNQGGGTEGYENDYGVGSNVGGGGFMSSQGGGEESKRNYANQSLRPVTIKQILEVSPPHPDMPHKLDGEELKQLTFVGVIRNIEVQSINATYFIEDGTGQIEVRVWGNDGDDPVSSMEQQEGIGVNKYVRVYGDLKFFNNRRNILGHSIKPIKDFNEITYHYLEALYIHLTKTRGPVNPGSGHPTSSQHLAGSAYTNPLGVGGQGSGSGGYFGDLKPAQAAVMAYVSQQDDDNPEGIHVGGIQRELGAKFSPQQIKDAIEWLTVEGHLYTTIDDDHVKSTGNT